MRTTKPRHILCALAGVIGLSVASLGPAWGSRPVTPRVERFTYHFTGHEFDWDGDTGELTPYLGHGGHGTFHSGTTGCQQGSDCFTLVARPGERSLTLGARRSDGGPAYLVYDAQDPSGPGAGHFYTGTEQAACGRATIGVTADETITVNFLDPPAGWYRLCTQGTDGELTATFR